jgi:Beta protein
MPILKGRRAEFSALCHVAEPVSSILRPLLEVLPDERMSVHGSSLRFAHRLMDSAPKDMIFAVDCHYLRPDGSGRPLQRVAQAIHEWGITMIPVFSPGDGQDPADVRVAADLHKSGGCLRLDRAHCLSIAARRDDQIPEVLDAADLRTTDIDLVIDLGDVCTRETGQDAPHLARTALAWAQSRRWRSVTLASGAFPVNISDLPLGTSTPLPRWDAVLWAELVGTPIGGQDVGYGDYAVSNPEPSRGFAPLPNLRYTAKRHWHVYRYPKSPDGGMRTFGDLCLAVMASNHWPAQGKDFSWGDEQVQLCAHGFKIGNPAMWRAFGISHHLAVVADRLTTLGEP